MKVMCILDFTNIFIIEKSCNFLILTDQSYGCFSFNGNKEVFNFMITVVQLTFFYC